jgi:hypothetical protein
VLRCKRTNAGGIREPDGPWGNTKSNGRWRRDVVDGSGSGSRTEYQVPVQGRIDDVDSETCRPEVAGAEDRR